MSELVKRVLGSVRGKLLDLTRRNRLLNYKESAKSIRIIDELPDEIFRLLVNDEKDMQFLPMNTGSEDTHILETDSSHELPVAIGAVASKHSDSYLQTPFGDSVLERRCKKLMQESRTAIEETGSNLLHIAIGILEWYESDESSEKTRAPLILLPVKIEKTRLDKKSNCYNYVISYTGEDIATNLSLAEKLKIDFELILPELGDCKTPEEYFEAVAVTVSHRKRWRVAREMVLGLFSFSKLLMYRDLDPAHWPTLTDHKNIATILAGQQEGEALEERPYGEEYDLDRDSKALDLLLVLDADSSQTSVIIDAIHKRINLVVEGPPGTGKSQTITNIIAAGLNQGLSILFVAEKKAALEVVRSRLNHAGLGDFCLELHSHKTQKGQMHSDITKRILKEFRDAATIDREVEDLARERDKLMSYTNLVNSVVGPNGETVYDIFWAVERYREETGGRELRFAVNNPLALSRNQMNERGYLLRDVARLRQELTDSAIQSWSNFVPINVLPGDERVLSEYMSNLVDLLSHLQCFLETHLLGCRWPSPRTVKELYALKSINISSLDDLPQDYFQNLSTALSQPENIVVLRELETTITAFRSHTAEAQVLTDNMDNLSDDLAKEIIGCSSALEAIGFGKNTFKELSELSVKQELIYSILVRLSAILDKARVCFAVAPLSFIDSRQVINLHHVLASAPFENAAQCHPEHTLESTVTVFQEARSQCEKIADDLSNHGNFFLLRYLPEIDELTSLARDLRSFRGSMFAIFSARYRSLRRTAKNLLTDPKQLKVKNLVERIEGLVDTLRDIDAVNSNQSYKQKLGPIYTGMSTDWKLLDEYITWAQNFATVTGSPSLAYSLSQRFSELSPQIADLAQAVKLLHSELEECRYDEHLDSSASIAEALPKFLAIIEMRNALLVPLKSHSKLDAIPMVRLTGAAKAYISANITEASLAARPYSELLGTDYVGVETDTERLLATSMWLATVRNEGKLVETVFDWLICAETARRKDILIGLHKEVESFWIKKEAIIAEISRYGGPVGLNPLWDTGNDHTLEQLIEILNGYLLHIGGLVSWGDYSQVLRKADELGLAPITDAISRERLTPDQSVAIYGDAAFEGMAREVLRLYPDLAGFTRIGYEASRERFAKIDRRIMENARERIAYKTSQRRLPRGIGSGPVKEHTDLQLLSRELQKKKRHIPIRQLVRRAGAALQGLKPCFMMSPLSVAQYLDPQNISFDLVVMDEASQLKPEDALGAIARAKQLIVVGDPKQLPPTSFFDRTDSGAEEDGDEVMAIQDTESILDICMTTYDKRRLRWHYRSAHESLIAFSNNRFYDDDLIIFPSPLGDHSNYGVHRHYIEGATYLKGRNRIEAETVVLAVVEHFRSNPTTSLGVATFNREQAELVSDILDNKQKEHSWLEKAIKDTEGTEEPFFVKNLENVQGDERDVIFVSTTYGPDPSTGRVFQRFGPIAGETGWRRLNVIFTRAKKQLELFTSLRAADIKLSESPSKGAVALKEYLDYAETGRLPDYGTTGSKEADSDFEVAVTHHLNLHGFKTAAQVGVAGFFIDIGVKHPDREGEFILGIECDGATYHSAKSVRDRDRLRQEILEKKGWRIHRIWSTDWFKNRDKEVQRLVEAVKYALKECSTGVVDTRFQDAIKAAIASIKPVQRLQIDPLEKLKKTGKDDVRKTGKLEVEPKPQKAINGLREELVEYRLVNILPAYNDDSKCLLRDEVLSRLIVHMPSTRDEFYKAVPMELRQKTDSRQMQYIEDILEIIDGYAC